MHFLSSAISIFQTSRLCYPHTPNRPKIKIPWHIAARSPPGSMDLDTAPANMTEGIDDLYRKRADWAAKTSMYRAHVFKGIDRPCDPVSATETLEDLSKLVSDIPRTHKCCITDMLGRPGWTIQSTSPSCCWATCILHVPQALIHSAR